MEEEKSWLEKFTEGLLKRQRKRDAESKKRKICLNCHYPFRPRTRKQKNNPFCCAECKDRYKEV